MRVVSLVEKYLSSFWHLVISVLDFFLSLFHVRLNDTKKQSLYQFFKFGIVGLSGTVFGYLLYLLFLLFFCHVSCLKNIDYLLANIFSWVCGVYWNFTWNWKYVFALDKNDVSWGRALLKTYITYGFTGLILSNLLAYIWVTFFKLDKVIVPIVNLLFSIPLNYLLNKYWAFNDKSKREKRK